MATMKAKNSSGEWVDIGLAGLMSEMKIAVVEDSSDTLSYDLSPYVKSNENFIFFFICGYGSPNSTGSNQMTALVHIDDLVYVGEVTQSNTHWRVDSITSIIETLNYNSSHEIDTWEDIFTWDEESRVLTFVRPYNNYSSMGDKALLLYTGIKEA